MKYPPFFNPNPIFKHPGKSKPLTPKTLENY
jgi:hypothetical protein